MIFFAAVSVALATASCQKDSPASSSAIADSLPKTPIRFSVADDFAPLSGSRSFDEATLETLAESGMYVTATRGKAGSSETFYMENVHHTVTGNASSSTYFWPAGSGKLNFYALNVSKTPVIKDSRVTTSVSPSDGDVVLAFADSTKTTPGSTVNLAFEHVFTRLYDIQLMTKDKAATATLEKVVITPKYNDGVLDMATRSILSGEAGTGQEMEITKSDVTYEMKSIGQPKIDRLLMPGELTMTVTYTLRRNGYVEKFTKSATVPFPAGYMITLSATLPDDAQAIKFNVSVETWIEDVVEGMLK